VAIERNTAHSDRSPAPLPEIPGHELILTLHEPVLVLDADLRVRVANPAFLFEFGLSDDAARGRSVYSLGGGAWGSAEVRELLERVVPTRDLVEDHLLTLPGQGPFGAGYRVNARPLRTGANQLHCLLLAFRRELPPREAPDEGSESLRVLASEHGADIVVLYDTSGRCVYLGAAAARVLGYERREWMAMTACDLIHPDDREAFVARLAPQEGGPAVVQAVARARRASGEYSWLEVTAQRVEHAVEGELVHAALRDVTQRKRAEDALRWLSRQTKLILDTAAEGIFGVDTLGTVTFANPAAASILERRVEDLIGNSYQQFVAQPQGSAGEKKPEDEIGTTLRDGRTRTVRRADFLRADGVPVMVEFTCSPARQHGRVVGAVITFRDVSERMKAEAMIRRSEWVAAVSQTVQAFRHEINNPLSALLAGVQLLEMGGNSPEEEREMVASVAAHARRIRDAVRQLTIAPPAPEE
jgi:PAS domain S-box-containing protein